MGRLYTPLEPYCFGNIEWTMRQPTQRSTLLLVLSPRLLQSLALHYIVLLHEAEYIREYFFQDV